MVEPKNPLTEDIHGGDEKPLFLWKFIIREGAPVFVETPTADGERPVLKWEGCLTVICAESAEEALEIAVADSPYDEPWLRATTPERMEIKKGFVAQSRIGPGLGM